MVNEKHERSVNKQQERTKPKSSLLLILIVGLATVLAPIYLLKPKYVTWHGSLSSISASYKNNSIYVHKEKWLQKVCVKGRAKRELEHFLVYSPNKQRLRLKLYDHYLVLMNMQDLGHPLLWHMYIKYDENNMIKKCHLRHENQPAPEGTEVFAYEKIKRDSSAIVFDLDGDGLKLTTFADTNRTFFDLDIDGYAERTGWVLSEANGGGDGLLALDRNNNSKIDGAIELFGHNEANGFALLAKMDSNIDGKIDNTDTQWADLIMWVDKNEDARSTPDELFTLDAFDITSINLSFTDSAQVIAGHNVPFISTFTIGGEDHIIGDVLFQMDNISSVFAQDYTLDVRALFLPTLRGYGEFPDLHIAMSIDNDADDPASLMSMISDLATTSTEDIFSNPNIRNDVRHIMFRLAGVDGIDPTIRGPNIDARELVYTERLLGKPFVQQGVYRNPSIFAAQDLRQSFNISLNHLYARLILQVGSKGLFTRGIFYNIASDAFKGDPKINANTLKTLETKAATFLTEEGSAVFWSNVVAAIEYSIGLKSLNKNDKIALETAIKTTNPSLTLKEAKDKGINKA